MHAAPQLSGTSCSTGGGTACPPRRGSSNPGAGATDLSPHWHQPLPGPEPPARGEPTHACPGEKGPLGLPWSLSALQMAVTLSLPASRAGWQYLSAAPSSCTPTAREAPSPHSSLPAAQRAATRAGPAAASPQRPPALSPATHSFARGAWGHCPALPRGPGHSMAGRQPPLPALPGPLTPPQGSGKRLSASACTSPRVGDHHLPCLLLLSP